MFGFIKKVFVVAMTFFSFNVLSVSSLECVSMKNQECKVREEVINVNTKNPVFYPFSVKVNKCLLNVVKNINLKAFNLISWNDEIKQIKWHESCKCEV